MVTGNSAELGRWQADSPLAMKETGTPVWQAEVPALVNRFVLCGKTTGPSWLQHVHQHQLLQCCGCQGLDLGWIGFTAALMLSSGPHPALVSAC